ncbi:hypothetical protein LOAG_04322 [Loa loa]|uniref:Uncharacterized protein n=1 Tax=Loa loa TaxID=7209 RepID=A0A1S0U2D8_LOALO|nr:hypothetical protein LOAG_04322 [Loa loa]EFO24159.1 hypothetical protein LOAG_04322 [Loa loa]
MAGMYKELNGSRLNCPTLSSCPTVPKTYKLTTNPALGQMQILSSTEWQSLMDKYIAAIDMVNRFDKRMNGNVRRKSYETNIKPWMNVKEEWSFLYAASSQATAFDFPLMTPQVTH